MGFKKRLHKCQALQKLAALRYHEADNTLSCTLLYLPSIELGRFGILYHHNSTQFLRSMAFTIPTTIYLGNMSRFKKVVGSVCVIRVRNLD